MTFNSLSFHFLGEVDSLLSTDESGKDLASVQNLTKKHQLLEADILAHEERISDMNEQADSLVSCEQFDTGVNTLTKIENCSKTKLFQNFGKCWKFIG